MRRLMVGLLVGSVLGVTGSSVVVAQSRSPELVTDAVPFVYEGRLGVPSAGFALRVPEEWWAFDVWHPDVVARTAAAFDEEWVAWVEWAKDWDPAVTALLMNQQDWGFCTVWADLDSDLTLDTAEVVHTALGSSTETIDLPGGAAVHRVTVGDEETTENFEWYRSGRWYWMRCSGDVLDEDWLSIAETFEFLPTIGGLQKVGEAYPAEIWDPVTETFSLTGSPIEDRFSHLAARLADGRVLVVGGGDAEQRESLASAEIWDPDSGMFSPSAAMTTPRTLPALTTLPDGRLLVSGGVYLRGDENAELASVEIWDSATESFAETGRLIEARAGHSATLLLDGTVLIAGGVRRDGDDLERLASVEVWDPASGESAVSSWLEAARSEHAAVPLPDGRVAIIGGTVSVPDEIWDPATTRSEYTEPTGRERRYGHTASLLPDGRVLLIGGLGRDDAASVAELWDPETSTFVEAGQLEDGRYKHTATLLSDGRVLVVGGRGPDAKQSSAWLWDPITRDFEPAGWMAYPRSHHTATLLADGRVLIVGGTDAAAD